MKTLMLSAALALSALSMPAAAGVSMCDFDSDYSVQLRGGDLRFHRGHGAPAELLIAGGRLYADGVEQPLAADDRQRLLQFEQALRALVPQVTELALDSVALATTAIGEVAKVFDDRPDSGLQARIDRIQQDLAANIEQAVRNGELVPHDFEDDIEQLVGEFVPVLVGNVTSAAVAAALSGDQSKVRAIEERARLIEQTIEREVEAQAAEIERRAEALCPLMAELHDLQAPLRLANGEPLDLLRM